MNKINTRTRAFMAPRKYFQGPGEIRRLESYTRRFGESVLIITGNTFYSKYCQQIVDDYKQTGSKLDIVRYQSDKSNVTLTEIKRIAEDCRDRVYDVVVGIGGGKVMDVAKAVANELGVYSIIVPTVVSSDAPTSALSVIYNEDGSHSHEQFYAWNPDIILLDTEIIIRAPVRMLVAGMADAMATYVEARACMEADAPSLVEDGYKRTVTGITIAKLAYDVVLRDGLKAKISAEVGACTEAVENIIEANTLMSGVGFEVTGSTGAHGFHNGLTTIPECTKYLHGEVVSFGIICQLMLENRDMEEIEKTVNFLISLGLPVMLEDIGITENVREKIHAASLDMYDSYHMNNEPFMVSAEMIEDAINSADAIGRYYKEKSKAR